MDTKLRQILELALRPETGEGESSAALAAARRIVAKQGMDLLGSAAPERVVYRDKVVYRKPYHSHTLELTLRFPATFHHAMIERIFQDAQELSCDIQLLSCQSLNEAILSGTVIKFKVLGSKSAVDAFNRNMDNYIDQMNTKLGTQARPSSAAPKPAPKPKGWFRKLFGG
jgi:hypothetical protein